jgi:hypothetical protein
LQLPRDLRNVLASLGFRESRQRLRDVGEPERFRLVLARPAQNVVNDDSDRAASLLHEHRPCEVAQERFGVLPIALMATAVLGHSRGDLSRHVIVLDAAHGAVNLAPQRVVTVCLSLKW